MNKAELEDIIIEKLKTVFDPEIPVNVYDLGFIYEIDINDAFSVNIKMTLTSPNCPVAESLPVDVRNAVQSVRGVTGVYVDVVFEPEWNQDMMTPAAKLELGLL
ncbi:MAG: iron-sulfur cluster assembly protein [Bacteroidales bacterium]|jgi:FeS assembly SUF system protein|nr:iron-sulfur cluster assembly protein [Bacteroidales bacterium]MDD4214842.1 iron-sulfur cluster assembly protein [Bacteroidales bacterium]